MRGVLSTIALALAVTVGAGATAETARADEALLKSGTSAYKMFCSHCHGLNMVNPGTSSYDLRKYPTDRKDDFVKVLIEGKGDMPAWGDILTADEIKALWHYVATRAGKEPPPQASAPAEKPEEQSSLETAPDGAVSVSAAEKPRTMTPGRLTVCLPKNGGVMAQRRARGGRGLDYTLSKAVAERLGLKLYPVWYESEQEEESSPVKETYALVSVPVCDLVPGFALYETALNGIAGHRAPLPRYEDRPTFWGPEHHVDLSPVEVTRPYLRMGMGLVHREGRDPGTVRRLDDVKNLRVGLEQGTLAGTLMARQGDERTIAKAQSFNPGPHFLWAMEQNAFDIALVTIGAYDNHAKQNAVTKLVLHPYRHPIGFNIAFAARKGTGVAAAVDSVLEALQREGEIARLARKAGVTWDAPEAPHISPPLTMRDVLTRR